MNKPTLRRPTFGMVIGTVAVLMLVSTGSAYAAKQITGGQIKNNTVLSADIKNGTLLGKDVKTATLTGKQIKDGSLSGADVLDQSLTGDDVGQLDGDADIIDNTISTFDLATDSVDSDEVLDFGLSNQDIGVLYATVNADATLAGSSGGVTSSKIGTGNYEVDFGRDIQFCAFTGTVGPATSGSALGELNVADRAGNVEAVFVDTNDSAGAASDRPFHLIVVC